jgi:hypothetical protein
MSKSICIETSTYQWPKNHKNTRLAVSLLDENNNGCGTRIKGAKFSDFSSIDTISVKLTLDEAKTLVNELQTLIKECEVK